jgi:hypothetical protein
LAAEIRETGISDAADVVTRSFAWYMEEHAASGYVFEDARIEARREDVFELLGIVEALPSVRR